MQQWWHKTASSTSARAYALHEGGDAGDTALGGCAGGLASGPALRMRSQARRMFCGAQTAVIDSSLKNVGAEV